MSWALGGTEDDTAPLSVINCLRKNDIAFFDICRVGSDGETNSADGVNSTERTANISSISVCLACEQAEKISKLEKAMREKDIEIKKMKDIISKLQQKMEEADRTEREADQVNTRGESAGCSSNERPSASYCK